MRRDAGKARRRRLPARGAGPKAPLLAMLALLGCGCETRPECVYFLTGANVMRNTTGTTVGFTIGGSFDTGPVDRPLFFQVDSLIYQARSLEPFPATSPPAVTSMTLGLGLGNHAPKKGLVLDIATGVAVCELTLPSSVPGYPQDETWLVGGNVEIGVFWFAPRFSARPQGPFNRASIGLKLRYGFAPDVVLGGDRFNSGTLQVVLALGMSG